MKITAENEKEYRGKMVRVKQGPLDYWKERQFIGMISSDKYACWASYSQYIVVWAYCETIPGKIRKPYTAETAPDRPSLRRYTWPVGCCVYPNIGCLGLWWRQNRGAIKEVTWAELAAEDSPWTDRAGRPLCIVEEGV